MKRGEQKWEYSEAPWSLQPLHLQPPYGHKAGMDTIACGTAAVAIIIAGTETIMVATGDITDIHTGIAIAHAGRTTPATATTRRRLTGISRRRRAYTS